MSSFWKPDRWHLGDVVRFLTFAMVTGLFFVWLVFGNVTITKQNQAILQGVKNDHAQMLARINESIVQNSVGDRTLVCILRITPEGRTDKKINRCLEVAEKGGDSL